MKRFLLFSGAEGAGCGWNDFVRDFAGLVEAQDAVLSLPHHVWWHIVDQCEGRIIERGIHV